MLFFRGANLFWAQQLGGMSMTDFRRRVIFRWPAGFTTLLLFSSFSTAQQGQFDGPAELPRVYVQSAMSDTPTPGKVVAVHEGDNLQSAINSANCGDRIELDAGAAFVGLFHFPEKPCDDSHWIVVRTSAPDSSLPPEGSRLTPCWAGVASLPGRPDFHCAATRNSLAKSTTSPSPSVTPCRAEQPS